MAVLVILSSSLITVLYLLNSQSAACQKIDAIPAKMDFGVFEVTLKDFMVAEFEDEDGYTSVLDFQLVFDESLSEREINWILKDDLSFTVKIQGKNVDLYTDSTFENSTLPKYEIYKNVAFYDFRVQTAERYPVEGSILNLVFMLDTKDSTKSFSYESKITEFKMVKIKESGEIETGRFAQLYLDNKNKMTDETSYSLSSEPEETQAGQIQQASATSLPTATSSAAASPTIRPSSAPPLSTPKQPQEAVATPTPANTDMNQTTGQKNALKSAKQYMNYSAFSYQGLIEQLEYEKYSHEDAVYAVNNCGADWNEQALKSAKSYLNYSAFSYSGLIGQLEYGKFTSDQAKYGADNCGADWNEQAAKSAKQYLNYSSFSRDSLISQLEYEGFTHDQAVYGAQANGL